MTGHRSSQGRDFVADAVTLHRRRQEALAAARQRDSEESNRRWRDFTAQVLDIVGTRLTRDLAVAFGAMPEDPEFCDLRWIETVWGLNIPSYPDRRWVIQPASAYYQADKSIVLATVFQSVPIRGHLPLRQEWAPTDPLPDVECVFSVTIEYADVEFRDLATFGAAVEKLKAHRAEQAARERAADQPPGPRSWWRWFT